MAPDVGSVHQWLALPTPTPLRRTGNHAPGVPQVLLRDEGVGSGLVKLRRAPGACVPGY